MPKARVVYKQGVSDPEKAHCSIKDAIDVAAEVYGEYVQEMVVTSLNDSKHRVGSFHYQDKAVDIRTKNLPNRESKRLVQKKIMGRLGKEYDVILEDPDGPNSHIHIEHDPD